MQSLWPVYALVAVGAIAARAKLFREPAPVLAALNRYLFQIAFPVLIARGLAVAPELRVSWGFVLTQAAWFGVVWGSLVAFRVSPTARLCVLFGNIAYVGVPTCERLWGPGVLPLAATGAALHVAFALSASAIGFADRRSGIGVGLLLRQPLLWSPLLGLALRQSGPPPALDLVLGPLAATASPLGLFTIGYHLYEHRARALPPSRAAFATSGLKVIAAPAVGLALHYGLGPWLGTSAQERQVAVALCAMPSAVGCFAMASEWRGDAALAAEVVVVSTALAALTLPLLQLLP